MKTKLITATLSAFALFGAVSYSSEPVENKDVSDAHRIGILCHRGYWNCEEAGYTRNSVASLRCAQEAGFWGSEFDLHLTLDEKIIIVHDDVLDGKRIEDNPYSEFEEIRLDNGEKIPTIDDYFAQGAKNPKLVLVCEIKKHSTPEREARLIELTFEKMKEYGLYNPERVAFVTFSRYACDLITQTEFMVHYLDTDFSPDELSLTGVRGVNYTRRVFKNHPDWIDQIRSHGMTVICRSVTNKEIFDEIVKYGVDRISSDNPMLVRKFLKEAGINEL